MDVRKKIESLISRLDRLSLAPSDRETILEALQDKLRREREPAVAQPNSPIAVTSVQLPSSIPEERKYRHRTVRENLGRKENIVEFLKRVWQSEMDAGLLTRAALRKLDSSADAAVEHWLANSPLPDDIKLPTKKALNDAALANPAISITDVHRLSRALARRSSNKDPRHL